MVDITAVKYVPCSRFVNILKNTPGACGFQRPGAPISKAEIITRLVTLNIPVYEVDAKLLKGQRKIIRKKKRRNAMAGRGSEPVSPMGTTACWNGGEGGGCRLSLIACSLSLVPDRLFLIACS